MTDKNRRTSLGSKIAVCVLTYNHAHMLESTLTSIQQQSLVDYEIIVSDDNSTDGTWELLQRFAAGDQRIRAIRTPRNLGMPGNANFAISQTERPYVALLHHDDLCRSDLLEKWACNLEKHSDASFVFNSYGIEASSMVSRVELPGDCIDGSWLLEHHLFPSWSCIIRGTALIRRSEWERIGGMRPQFELLADIDLWMRLAMVGTVGYVDEPLLIVRQERPLDYPEEYKQQSFSWKRKEIQYQIHAVNRRVYFSLSTFRGRWQWLLFRIKLNLETTKWLTYAVFRGKSDIISSSIEGATEYDFFLLRMYRRILISLLG